MNTVHITVGALLGLAVGGATMAATQTPAPEKAEVRIVATEPGIGDTPGTSVHLGQRFFVEVKVPESWDPGETITVTLSTTDGETSTLTLWNYGSEDGVVRFESNYQTIGGDPDGDLAGLNSVDGTIEDFDDLTNGGSIGVRLDGFGGPEGRTTQTRFKVYDSDIKQGIGRNLDALDTIEDDLASQEIALDSLDGDPRFGSPEAQAELGAWRRRIATQRGWLREARERLARADSQNPIEQLLISKTYVTLLIRDYSEEVRSLDQIYLENTRQLAVDIKRAVTDAYTDWAVAVMKDLYVLVAHWSLVAPTRQLIFGVNEFNQDASRAHAAGELALAWAFIRGGPKLRDAVINKGGLEIPLTRGSPSPRLPPRIGGPRAAPPPVPVPRAGPLPEPVPVPRPAPVPATAPRAAPETAGRVAPEPAPAPEPAAPPPAPKPATAPRTAPVSEPNPSTGRPNTPEEITAIEKFAAERADKFQREFGLTDAERASLEQGIGDSLKRSTRGSDGPQQTPEDAQRIQRFWQEVEWERSLQALKALYGDGPPAAQFGSGTAPPQRPIPPDMLNPAETRGLDPNATRVDPAQSVLVDPNATVVERVPTLTDPNATRIDPRQTVLIDPNQTRVIDPNAAPLDPARADIYRTPTERLPGSTNAADAVPRTPDGRPIDADAPTRVGPERVAAPGTGTEAPAGRAGTKPIDPSDEFILGKAQMEARSGTPHTDWTGAQLARLHHLAENPQDFVPAFRPKLTPVDVAALQVADTFHRGPGETQVLPTPSPGAGPMRPVAPPETTIPSSPPPDIPPTDIFSRPTERLGPPVTGTPIGPGPVAPLMDLSTIPRAVPLAYAPGDVRGAQLQLDDVLTDAGLDMAGTFRRHPDTGTVTYEDGLVVVTARIENGQLLIDAREDPGMVTTPRPASAAPDAIDFSVFPGDRPRRDSRTFDPLDLNVLSDPTTLNPPGANGAGNDPAVQRMFSVLDYLTEAIVIAKAPEREPPTLVTAFARLGQMLLPWWPGARTDTLLSVSARPPADRGDVWLEPLPTQRGAGPTSTGSAIKMFLTSLGSSTGEAFQVRIVNDGSRPVKISGGNLVLEPVSRSAQAELRRQIRTLPAQAITKTLNAYCLEFTRLTPAAGTIFRVAAPELQQQFAPMRYITDASRVLRDGGGLSPDSSPDAYFHSIRQWAIWTSRQGFDEQGFLDAFVDRTRKNVEAAKQPWTAAAEAVVRGLAPGRWQDVSRVLREADRLAAAAARAGAAQ